MTLDQRLGGDRVVGEERRGDEQHRVTARGLPVPAEQLVGEEHQHAGTGDRDAGHLGARHPFQPVGAQDHQREHRAACEDQRTRECRRPVNAEGHQDDVQQMPGEPEFEQRPRVGARHARPVSPVARAQQQRRSHRHDQVAHEQKAARRQRVEDRLLHAEVGTPDEDQCQRGPQRQALSGRVLARAVSRRQDGDEGVGGRGHGR